jgi:hypothetical protein
MMMMMTTTSTTATTMEQSVESEFAGETEVLEKTCPNATSPTTNPT